MVLKTCIISCAVRVCSVMSDSFRPHGLEPIRLLCPWDFPDKNTGVGCHFLLQGIFMTQGSNPCLLHWQADSLPLHHLGSPLCNILEIKIPSQFASLQLFFLILLKRMERQFEGEWIHVSVRLSPFAVHLKPSQHC